MKQAELMNFNEYGFLPVPPACHEVDLADLPGVFANSVTRSSQWRCLCSFFEHLRSHTSIRSVYLDGEFVSAADDPEIVEVGIELHDGVTRDELAALEQPFTDEWGIEVNFYAPRRPDRYNFHESFQRPEPSLGVRDLPDDFRKGYLKIRI